MITSKLQNLSSLTKSSDKAFMNMEAKFSALKGYIDCEICIGRLDCD